MKTKQNTTKTPLKSAMNVSTGKMKYSRMLAHIGVEEEG